MHTYICTYVDISYNMHTYILIYKFYHIYVLVFVYMQADRIKRTDELSGVNQTPKVHFGRGFMFPL